MIPLRAIFPSNKSFGKLRLFVELWGAGAGGLTPEESDKIRDSAIGALRKMPDCSIGFLKISSSEPEPLGSGTLVRVGRARGIITAAHVWEAMECHDRVGFYLNSTRRSEIQSALALTSDLVTTIVEAKPRDEAGPDLAFIKLPDRTASLLEMHGVFLNVDRHRDIVDEQTKTDDATHDAVVGMIAEWEPSVTMRGEARVVRLNALTNVGVAWDLEDGREGCDRLRFTPMPEQGFMLPNSYGGVSGGGLFRVFVNEESESRVSLFGLAYWETMKDGKADEIICHGPQSIYGKLFPWSKSGGDNEPWRYLA